MSVRTAALLTTHNRRETTLGCLRRLGEQEFDDGTVEPIVVDAASDDGTPEAVAKEFPTATLLSATANTYWNGGMRLAFQHAAAQNFDFFLWLNDDTVLDKDALARLLATERSLRERGEFPAVVVGCTRDPVTNTLTYGGVYRPAPRTRPLRFEMVSPGETLKECETMNGNCVLVPRTVQERIGILDPGFTHGMGDYDYGLRARQSGVGVWMAPGTIGTCARNEPVRAMGFRADIRRLASPKGLPWREWTMFARRWGGPLWPVFAVSPYGRHLARRVAGSNR